MSHAQVASECPAWTRRDLLLLTLLGVAHLVLLGWAVQAALAQPFALYEPRPYVRVGLTAALVLLVLAVPFRRVYRMAAAGLVITVAAALLSPGVVATVALWLLSVTVLGRAVLRGLQLDTAEAGIGIVAVLIGVVLWIGVIGATASLRIHFTPLYTIALLAPLAWSRGEAAAIVISVWRRWHAEATRAGTFDILWTALLGTVTILHVFIVAKPEAGYDANTMHLQVPLLLAHGHRFAFDVGRYAWAVMPLGADWAFGAAYLLAGEAGARLVNLCFGALACALIHALVRRHASSTVALASVALLASTPLAFLETGSLFVENLWLAFLLAALWVALRYAREPEPRVVALLLLLAAGAMQCKVLALGWLAPLFLGLAIVWRRFPGRWSRPAIAFALLAGVIGAWPYANAWVRTGNPVFPYMNAVFQSRLFDSTENLVNDLYRAPLGFSSFYDLIVHSGPYIEGSDGAAGLHWLVLLPLVLVALVRTRRRATWALVALGAFYFVAVYTQQSYLRYLLPVFAVLAIVGGWSLATIPSTRVVQVAMLAAGIALVVLHVRLIYTASWIHADLCPRCAIDTRDRERHLARYIPERVIGETLNRLLPADARVMFLMPNAPSPAGYLGYSRATNWHDNAAFAAIVHAENVGAIERVLRSFEITHAVCREQPTAEETEPVIAFCGSRIVPIWHAHGQVVGVIRQNGG